MDAITVKVEVNSETVADITRTPVELLIQAVHESGEDQSDTVTMVTPRSMYVYYLPSKFKIAVQETNMSASAELVC